MLSGRNASGSRNSSSIAAINHVHQFAPACSAHIDAVVYHEQIAPFHQFDAHLLREKGVLKVRRVIYAGCEQHDARAAHADAGRERTQVLQQLRGVLVYRAHMHIAEPVGKEAGHRGAVREYVAHAARATQVVFQYVVPPFCVTDEVRANNVNVLIVRHVNPDDFTAEVARAHDERAGNDVICENLLLVVNIMDEHDSGRGCAA